jgi:hypothetical protein
MSYTDIMKNDLLCNYINIQNRNASDILLDCINQPNQKQTIKKEISDGIINTLRPIPESSKDIMEGFTSDMNFNGGGVENKRQGNKDPRGNKFCRNGQVCDYSHASQLYHLNPGTDGETPYQYCPSGSKFLGVNQTGEIVCSK